VGQKSGELFNKKIHTSLQEISNPVDLAILIVPPQAAAQSIRECGERGIKAAIIMSSGFRETGPEGAALEEQCTAIARQYQMRLLGPNCIGTIDTHLPLDTTFLQPPMPAQGGIAFVSHSGAFCAAIIDWAREQGFGFSQIVSLGNQADVNETDALIQVAEDEHTRAIVLYMEGVSDGERFVQAASEITKRKPVIALKVGRFESGKKAAASHTGALAGSESAFDAAFHRTGILRADSVDQMFDWARALESCPLPRGRNIAILTDAGGPGVIAADSLEHNGLSLAQLTESTIRALSAILPAAASLHNPVDMLASASPETYAACLRHLLQDEQVHGCMVILPPPPMFKAEDVAQKVIEVAKEFDKPIVVALMGSTLVENALKLFRAVNIPTYPFPERAATALGALAKRAEYLSTPARAATRILEFKTMDPRTTSPEDMLEAYGIHATPIQLARSVQEAKQIAQQLGFPVVMKIASSDISHKSDVGGVILNLADESAVEKSYGQMMARIKSLMPDARIEGVHIQHQVPPGQEVIIGAVRDPQFKAMVMFGSGGVEVEGLKDVAFGLAPLGESDAEYLIQKTWAGKKLSGFRNIAAADRSAVVEVLVRLSWLIYDHEEIEEIEINPLRVHQTGAAAVDVRVKLRP
jgi:acetyltransferase